MGRLLIIVTGLQQRATGGVTMHVHRLLKRLIEPFVPNYSVCDYRKEGFVAQVLMIKEADVMHIHVTNAFLKLFYVIMGKICNTRSIITVHGKYGSYGFVKNIIHYIALKLCDVPVLINKESYDAVKGFNHRAVLIPAFIPPIDEEETLAPEIEQEVRFFKSAGTPLMVTNASRRAFTDDKKEVYGIEFLIDFFREHSEFSLIVLDPQGEYLRLLEGELPDRVKIITGQHSFYGVVKLADIVIRNTPTDGDSFSVKEALCLRKPVLATDAVSRPSGVILFKYNDAKSLLEAIKVALHSKENVTKTKEADGTKLHYQLYKKMNVIG